jgi:hypothetical protein
MQRITLTLAARTDGQQYRDPNFDESKISYGPGGRIYLRVVDIVRVIEEKETCAIHIVGESSYSSGIQVIDKYNDIIAKINSNEEARR